MALKYAQVPSEILDCCDLHNACYQICSSERDTCDHDMTSCLRQTSYCDLGNEDVNCTMNIDDIDGWLINSGVQKEEHRKMQRPCRPNVIMKLNSQCEEYIDSTCTNWMTYLRLKIKSPQKYHVSTQSYQKISKTFREILMISLKIVLKTPKSNHA